MTTLITGGAGFIGSHLAARLLAEENPVVILDNFDSYYDPAVKRANIQRLGEKVVVVEGDVRDAALIERLFDEYGITRVAHLGGLAGVRYSVDNGALYADVNTRGSVNLMDAARKHDVSIFIQASTSSVYGATTKIPFSEEDAPDQPLSPYPASKRAAEIFGHSYHHLFGLNVTVLRFFNVYGPNGRPDMMPLRAIHAILKGDMIDLYNGGDIKRDWTYIEDIVDGITAALKRPMGYRIFNLGYGSPILLTDFIHIYEDLIGKKAITRSVPAPASEPPINYCDNSLAMELLSFSPKVGIRQGLKNTWDWYQQQHKIP